MRKFLFLAVSLAVLGFMSCSSDSDFQEEVSTTKTGNYSFVYKGTTYSSNYTTDSNSTMVFENNEVNELYKKLSDLPQLTTLVKEDGSIELFDTTDEALAKPSNTAKNMKSRSANAILAYDLSYFPLPNYAHTMWRIQGVQEDIYKDDNAVYYRQNMNIGTIFRSFIFTLERGDLTTPFVKEDVMLVLYEATKPSGKSIVFEMKQSDRRLMVPTLEVYPFDNCSTWAQKSIGLSIMIY